VATSVTAMLCAARSLAVPPVERISTLRRASARAAIDTENARGAHLIAFGVVERGFQQGLLDLA
jgi:hypothetical protein